MGRGKARDGMKAKGEKVKRRLEAFIGRLLVQSAVELFS